ncbi:MAG: S8 family serine peptidase [Spirochaetaceae bacterium]|nr:S8 family serine peptidase [Spirochaetaceae bacterium]
MSAIDRSSLAASVSILALGIVTSYTAIGDDNTTLPSLETQNAIRALPVATPSTPPGHKPDYLDILILPSGPVSLNLLDIYPLGLDSSSDVSRYNDYPLSENLKSSPFAARNSMILRFEPDALPSQVRDYVDRLDLRVVQTFPEIGAIEIEVDLKSYVSSQMAGSTPREANQALFLGLVAASEYFQSDPIVRSAAPDLLLGNQQDSGTTVDNLLSPVSVIISEPEETINWGVIDTEANRLWSHSETHEAVVIGVLDTGFAEHEDLHFVESLIGMTAHDHGNHVAGIACGRHNGRGIRGVLPNCSIRARLVTAPLSTKALLMLDFDDMEVLNVSIGYDWHRKNINPDLPASEPVRKLVAGSAEPLLPVLERADEKGEVIFSAAGNDSLGLSNPISVKYASPFNWAAVTAREEGIAQSGVIVEAHDIDGRRAPFSNTGGHLSCPGVNIKSAVAFDPQGRGPHPSVYGTMSGTSMASPHCAAGYLLFRLIRPEYSSLEAVDCLRRSSHTSTSNTPILRLTQATDACPKKREN